MSDNFNFNMRLSKIIHDHIIQNINSISTSPSFIKKIQTNYMIVQHINSNITFDEYVEYTKSKLASNDINTQLLYMSSPTKQNIYESLQISIMSEYLNMLFKRYNRERFGNTKSFDGINEESLTILQCKYINEHGGAQDNQFNDLIKFNQPLTKYNKNYLVISGKYGIKLMRQWLLSNKLCDNTFIAILDDNIEIICPDIITEYNKFYSISNELVSNVELSDYIDSSTLIIEPFVGEYDLLKLFSNIISNNPIRAYDIINPYSNPPFENCVYTQLDTFLNVVFEDVKDAFIITNPPYRAKNKLPSDMKVRYKSLLSDVNDLYQIFIKQLISNRWFIGGGFIIVPSNFIFGKQSGNILTSFLKYFQINILNIFEKKVFENTTQSVVSILFTRKKKNINNFKCTLFRENEQIPISKERFEYIINFDFTREYCLNSDLIVMRNYNTPNGMFKTDIRISLLDYNMKAYIEHTTSDDKITDRAFMTVCLNREFNNDQQNKIVEEFNTLLSDLRKKTYSLVLTSYREFDRKRLTFEEAYLILHQAIHNLGYV